MIVDQVFAQLNPFLGRHKHYKASNINVSSRGGRQGILMLAELDLELHVCNLKRYSSSKK